MLTKVVKYTDFNGNARSDTLYFNLSEAEIARLEFSYPNGLESYVNKLNSEERPDEILDLFEKVIQMSYGEKSEDGRHFRKSPEKTTEFMQSVAYNSLFMELLTNADTAAQFFSGLIFIQPKKE